MEAICENPGGDVQRHRPTRRKCLRRVFGYNVLIRGPQQEIVRVNVIAGGSPWCWECQRRRKNRSVTRCHALCPAGLAVVILTR